MKFSDLDLDPKVMQAVAEAGYDTPTPIQMQAIPNALMGRDILGIAQTGSGKTAAFTLPMISILAQGRARARMPRSLILCPTRELAAQVAEAFETYGKHHKLTKALLIGGTSFKDQDKLIDKGVDVLIATPGRLLDHHERGKLMLTGVQVMVVDEADRMLDMGFIPDIERIFNLTPFTRQTLFFSATMPPEITRLTEAFLHNPVRVEVAKQATTAESIEQSVVRHRPSAKERADREKRELLAALIRGEAETLTNAIVFCNRKRDVDVVFKALKKDGFNVGALHGDLEQSVRTRTLDGFRHNEITVLVASDVAARGLDIPTVSHVLNYDVPIHAEDYVHRIGRTGRAGRKGVAVTLAGPADGKYLDKIVEMIGRAIPERANPLLGDAPAPAEVAAVEAPAVKAADEAEAAPAKPRRTRTRRPRAEAAPETIAAETSASESTPEAPMPEAPQEIAAPEALAVIEPETVDPRAPSEAAEAPRRNARRDAPPRAEPREDSPRADRRDDGGRSGRRDEAPRTEKREDAPRADKRDEGGRGDRRRDDSGRARWDDRRGGAPVVGMGDHVPAFLQREIDLERLFARSDSEDQEAA